VVSDQGVQRRYQESGIGSVGYQVLAATFHIPEADWDCRTVGQY